MYTHDEFSIGTVGFAQVGRPDYDSKIKIEKEVITDYFHNTPKLEVPEEFCALARFRWKLCPHDFGSYYDYQIYYNRAIIERLEDSDDEADEAKVQRFYDWVNECESALGENEETLYEIMEKLYRKEITMEVVHKKFSEENGLKAV